MTIQTYNGGNKLPTEAAAMAQDMENIRTTVFQSPIGEIGGTEFTLCLELD